MKLLKFTIALCIGFLLIGESSGMGISPGMLDYVVMKGEPSLNYFTILNANEAFTANISVSCPDSSMEEWFSIDPSGVVEISGMISKGVSSKKKVNVTVKTSEDIPSGYYECYIKVIPIKDETENMSGGGASFIIGGSVTLNINVSGDEIINPKVYETRASDTEVGKPSVFMIKVANYKSNVKIKPVIRVDVIKEGNVVDSVEKITEYIIPGGWEIVNIKWDTTNATPGDYIAHFDVLIGNKKMDSSAYILGENLEKKVTIEQDVPFIVHESGYFTKTGAVVGVKADETINNGEISEIVVQFKNTGEVEITAKSEIKVYGNDNLINLLESNSLSILPGETGSLTSYFKSEEDGDYLLEGKVIYENKEAQFGEEITIKVSSEKNDTVQQEPPKPPKPDEKTKSNGGGSSLLLWGVGILAAILIIAIIVLMRK